MKECTKVTYGDVSKKELLYDVQICVYFRNIELISTFNEKKSLNSVADN